MKYTICALVQIEFECKENKLQTRDINQDILTAVNLAIQPNYHTIENGISLNDVKVTIHNQQTFNFLKQ